MNESWARTIIQVVGQEYPASMHHVSSAPDTAVPHELHPAFWGSFDWHSCVHMLCSAAKLHVRDGDPRLANLLDERLTPEHVAPAALFLVSPLCGDRTGHVLAVAGARMYAYKVIESEGSFKDDNEPWTAHEIADHWERIIRGKA